MKKILSDAVMINKVIDFVRKRIENYKYLERENTSLENTSSPMFFMIIFLLPEFRGFIRHWRTHQALKFRKQKYNHEKHGF